MPFSHVFGWTRLSKKAPSAADNAGDGAFLLDSGWLNYYGYTRWKPGSNTGHTPFEQAWAGTTSDAIEKNCNLKPD
ncbi:hypothetical protein [Hymenobacter lapidarius]|uniref:hypothetical protein n=1 Tax=Hymenobacter lapidarius TaxID=1908237 RepID=UPI000F78A59B|nr:hypothetical protein [Hymenobacter lapidarius]